MANVSPSQKSVVVRAESSGPGCLVQALWFIFIGWWLGQLWILAAWFLMLIVIGIPLSIMMFNKLPLIIALRQPKSTLIVTADGHAIVRQASQVNIVLRIIYFILIGWWFSFLWLEIAYLLCATIIGLPLGFWMFDKTPVIVSLHQGG